MARLLIYDRTCRGRGPAPGLSRAWSVGSALYRASSWIDAARGVASWREAFEWLARVLPGEPIEEIQFWGHGKWGFVLVGDDVFDRRALGPGHALSRGVAAVRERLAPRGALVWLRTCEAFGARRGQDFAGALADALGCDVAGHTYVIGVWQSGLHALSPGCAPSWAPDEGLRDGSPAEPVRAAMSLPGEPRTIHCLVPRLPAFARAPG